VYSYSTVIAASHADEKQSDASKKRGENDRRLVSTSFDLRIFRQVSNLVDGQIFEKVHGCRFSNGM